MKKVFALMMLMVASVMSVSAFTIVKASGKSVTKQVTGVSGFNEVNVKGSVDVIYKESKTTKVQIVADEKFVPNIEVKQSGKALLITQKSGVSFNAGKVKTRVEVYAPGVKKFFVAGSSDVNIYSDIVRDEFLCDVKGSGDITTYGIKADKIVVGISGSGDFDARNLEGKEISIGISGSGDAKVKRVNAGKIAVAVKGSGDVSISEGSATEANFAVKGSGDIKAVNLRATKTTAVASGSSDVKCYAGKELVATTKGSSEVVYYGSPSKVVKQGNVKHKGN